MIPRSTTLTAAGRAIRSRIELVVGLALAVALVGWLLGRFGSNEVVQGPDGSMFVSDLNGTAAAFELAADLGVTVVPWVEPLDTAREAATILILDPDPEISIAPAERAHLDAHLAAGGRVVISGPPHPDLVGSLLPADLAFGYRAQPDAPVRFPLAGVGGVVETGGVRNLTTAEPHLPLVGDPPVAVAFSRGAGVVFYVSDGSIVHNRRFDVNAPWVEGLFGPGPLLVDERRHGFAPRPPLDQPGGLVASLPAEVRRTLLLLLVPLAAALVAYGRRWTPVEASQRRLKPARAELVEAAAGLLLRSGDPGTAALAVTERVETLLRRELQRPEGAIDAADAAERLGLDQTHVAAALEPQTEDDLVLAQRLLATLTERTI